MKKALSHATGLEARFEAEVAAANVRHNLPEQRFELEADGQVAVAEYRMEEGRMIITHTFVPPELRGKGMAERLVTVALEYARAKELRVVPQCSYVEIFLRRHPQFADLREQ